MHTMSHVHIYFFFINNDEKSLVHYYKYYVGRWYEKTYNFVCGHQSVCFFEILNSECVSTIYDFDHYQSIVYAAIISLELVNLNNVKSAQQILI